MADDLWTLDEISVDVAGFFTTEHTFHAGGRTLATMKVPAGNAEATYRGHEGRLVVIRRTGCLSGGYEMKVGGVIRGTAAPRGAFKPGYALRFDGEAFEIVPAGIFRQDYLLVDTGGSTLLRASPQGVFKRGAYLSVSQPLPLPLVVLAYFMYTVIQAQTAAVAATAAT
ncbi:MAG: hypothetical protein PVG11_03380 [Anaerolineae bacterium]|jgi:hypothetical protein